MENVIVIDIGSARTKIAIALDGNSKIERLKDETNIASYMDMDGAIDKIFIRNSFVKTLEAYKQLAVEKGCTLMLTIGTHAIRSSKNASEIIEIIEEVVGKLNIIDGTTEGRLFYRFIKEKLLLSNPIVCDIGGGSVQIVLGEKQNLVFSIPTGTFSLEKEFQKDKDFCSLEDANMMRMRIRKSISDIKMEEFSKVLVMGSNSMKDFIVSSSNALGYSISSSGLVSIELIRKLYNEIIGKNYASLTNYFPQNNMFMYGADKALMNVLEICDHFGIMQVSPTNESVSSALIETLSTHPYELEDLDIHPVKI